MKPKTVSKDYIEYDFHHPDSTPIQAAGPAIFFIVIITIIAGIVELIKLLIP